METASLNALPGSVLMARPMFNVDVPNRVHETRCQSVNCPPLTLENATQSAEIAGSRYCYRQHLSNRHPYPV
jgi:hypothetical protein